MAQKTRSTKLCESEFHDLPLDIIPAPVATQTRNGEHHLSSVMSSSSQLVQTIGQYDQYEDEFFQSLIQTAQEMVLRNEEYLASLIAERNKRIQAKVTSRKTKEEGNQSGRFSWKHILMILATTMAISFALNTQPHLLSNTMELLRSSIHTTTATSTSGSGEFKKKSAASHVRSTVSSSDGTDARDDQDRYRRLLERTLQ